MNPTEANQVNEGQTSLIQTEWEKYRDAVFRDKPTETSNEKLHWLAGVGAGLCAAGDIITNNGMLILTEAAARRVYELAMETRKMQLKIAEELLAEPSATEANEGSEGK